MDFPDDLMHLIRTDEPLGPLAWLGIGGPARFFAEPMDAADVQRLVAAAQEQGLSVRILGGGSNITNFTSFLIDDKDGCIVKGRDASACVDRRHDDDD